MLTRLRERRWLRWLLAGLVVVLIAGGAGAAFLLSHKEGNVSNPHVEFRSQPAPTAPTPAPKDEGRGAFDWPVYGYTPQRTRYLPLGRDIRPPFALRWAVRGSTLLEFPPVLGAHSLFLLKDDGALYGITRKTGAVRWRRKIGSLAASSPAYAHGKVFAVALTRFRGAKGGRVVALDSSTGRTLWGRKLPSRSESSPLVSHGTVYFGTQDGTIYALRATDGFVRWTARAPGAVKGGLALDGGRLFVGDYSGHIQSIDAASGRVVWRKATNGAKFGLSSGTFYATPAVAYGRVYIGNTDGFMYSYSERTGQLAWRHQTGNYVYSSAAVAPGPGGRPTVFVGSYAGALYAFDARSGAVLWKRRTEGKVSGGITVLGDLAFYSTLKKFTAAVRVTDGGQVWRTHRGQFNPVVSDGRGLFLVGTTSLFGYDTAPPVTHDKTPAIQAPSAKRQTPKRARRRAHLHRQHAHVGQIVCFRHAGHRTCRPKSRIVCIRHKNGKQTCRPKRPIVCIRHKNGKRVCRPEK